MEKTDLINAPYRSSKQDPKVMFYECPENSLAKNVSYTSTSLFSYLCSFACLDIRYIELNSLHSSIDGESTLTCLIV